MFFELVTLVATSSVTFPIQPKTLRTLQTQQETVIFKDNLCQYLKTSHNPSGQSPNPLYYRF